VHKTTHLPVFVTCSIVEHCDISPAERCALLRLYERAFEEEFDAFLRSYAGATHILLHENDRLVATGCWLERSLQQGIPPNQRPCLRTAYIEGVAVDPACQRRGYGTAVMDAISQHLWEYDLAALSAGEPAFYTRLGWEPWHGLTHVRTPQGLLPTPDEGIMIRRTGRTPAWLDPCAPLSCEWRDAPEIW